MSNSNVVNPPMKTVKQLLREGYKIMSGTPVYNDKGERCILWSFDSEYNLQVTSSVDNIVLTDLYLHPYFKERLVEHVLVTCDIPFAKKCDLIDVVDNQNINIHDMRSIVLYSTGNSMVEYGLSDVMMHPQFFQPVYEGDNIELLKSRLK